MSAAQSSENQNPSVVCRDEADCDDLDLKLSKAWLRIAIAGVFAGQGMMFSLALNMTPPEYGSTPYWILHGGLIFSSLVVMAFLGPPLFVSTFTMLRRRRLSIEGLFTLSLLGAFVGSVVGSVTGRGDVFYEIVAIVIAIYTFGRMLSERSQSRMRLESARLRERFDRALTLTAEGTWESRLISDVPVGARVRVNPGEAISVDGHILKGVGYVQETALSGEPLPAVKREGDLLRAGTYAVDTRFEIEVTASIGERELDRILNTVEASDGRPSELQVQANDLIQIFLPVVVAVSLCTAIYWSLTGTWIDAVLNSMAVLLVACPCALGLATPVAISQGLFKLSRLGLLSRDGALIDALARTKRIFFDKTGTLTESSLRVTECWVSDDGRLNRDQLLSVVGKVEGSINHPAAVAISRYIDSLNLPDVEDVSNLNLIPGRGISFNFFSHLVRVGEGSLAPNDADLEEVAAKLHSEKGKRIYILTDDTIVACFVLEEFERAGLIDMWPRLRAMNVEAEILTGDPMPEFDVPAEVSMKFGMSSDDKVASLIESRERGDQPLLVGDGINDAAAMSVASGSIAMGAGANLTSSVAMSRLDNNQIEVIPDAISLARGIYSKLRGNLIYAFSYNVIGMTLAATGHLHPVAAAMIMLISSFLVSARALR